MKSEDKELGIERATSSKIKAQRLIQVTDQPVRTALCTIIAVHNTVAQRLCGNKITRGGDNKLNVKSNLN